MRGSFILRALVGATSLASITLVAKIAAAPHRTLQNPSAASKSDAARHAHSDAPDGAPDCICAETTADPQTATPTQDPLAKRKAPPNTRGPSAETKAKMAAERERRLTEWRGTKIERAPAAEDAQFMLQDEIAQAFQEQDPTPNERLKAFDRWLSHKSVRVLGWHGRICSVIETTDGWLVEVRIRPRLESVDAPIALTEDCRIETWLYSGKKLRFLKSEVPPDNRSFLITL